MALDRGRIRGVVSRAAAVSGLLAWCLASGGGPARAQAAPQPMLGTAAPGFELKTTTGETLGLAGLRGRYVVLHFGASW